MTKYFLVLNRNNCTKHQNLNKYQPDVEMGKGIGHTSAESFVTSLVALVS